MLVAVAFGVRTPIRITITVVGAIAVALSLPVVALGMDSGTAFGGKAALGLFSLPASVSLWWVDCGVRWRSPGAFQAGGLAVERKTPVGPFSDGSG